MAKQYQKFEEHLASRLKEKHAATAFLNGALVEFEGDGDAKAFLHALRCVANAQGIGNLQMPIGKAVPRFDVMHSILQALGYRLKVEVLPNIGA